MEFNLRGTACALSLAMGAIAPITANAITYQIAWTGINNYTLTGLFSYDDRWIDTGIVNESVIDTFMIEGFHNGISMGNWNLTDGSDSPHPFNFNFNTTTELFILGGTGDSKKGQAWNRRTTGLGFESGNDHMSLTLDGINLTESHIQTPGNWSALTATVIPVPAAIYLFASGLLGFLGISWSGSRKRR